LIASSTDDVLAALQSSEAELGRIAQAARGRVLAEHTGVQRAVQFEQILEDIRAREMATA
jgi:hypothetical protein